MPKEQNETNLPAPTSGMGIIDVTHALKEWEAYLDLTDKMLNTSDYQSIGGKKFKKKSAARKYARAFRITDEVMEKEINKDKDGRVTEASFLVRATLPDGRYTEGWGNCSKFEKGFTKANHDIPATAHTRAKNRAIFDLIGSGEVSAEEMAHKEQPVRSVKKTVTPPSPPSPEPPAPQKVVKDRAKVKVAGKEVKSDLLPDYENVAKECAPLRLILDEMTKEKLPVTEGNIIEVGAALMGNQELTPGDLKVVRRKLGIEV